MGNERIRKPDLLRKIFRQYLVPMIVLSLASSLSEFVDSIVVSGLLGRDALAIVNMGMPIVLAYNMIAVLIGIGGSTEYARCIGERRLDDAKKNYTVSVISLLAMGVVVTVLGFVFARPIAGTMTHDAKMVAALLPYLQRLSMVAIPFIFVNSLAYFMTSAGEPNFATGVIIVANVINIIMDVVYIRVCHMGVNGAAIATLTGYMIAGIVIFIVIRLGKTSLGFCCIKKADGRLLIPMCATGIAVAMGQLGFSCKIYGMNYLANQYGGTDGVVVFSLCIQTLSILSVFLAGVSQCVLPIVATLAGEDDDQGIKMIVNYGVKYLAYIVIALVLLFEIFPQMITALYSIKAPEIIRIAYRAVRIFSVTHLIRSFYILFMMYYSAIGKKRMAFICSMLDSFLVIPFAALLCIPMGIDGIWYSFPISSVFVMLYVIAAAAWENKKSNGSTRGIFLFRVKSQKAIIWNVTVESTIEDAVTLSKDMCDFVLENGCSKKLANEIALISEEMIGYIVENSEKKSMIDVLLKIYADRVCMYFRNEGKPLSALNVFQDKGNQYEIDSKKLLHLMTDEVESERVLGMNSTRIITRKNLSSNQ